jgi:hypothetical protein
MKPEELTPKQEMYFEDDAGNLHTMIVDRMDQDNRTVLGWTTVRTKAGRKRVYVAIPEHRIRQ